MMRYRMRTIIHFNMGDKNMKTKTEKKGTAKMRTCPICGERNMMFDSDKMCVLCEMEQRKQAAQQIPEEKN